MMREVKESTNVDGGAGGDSQCGASRSAVGATSSCVRSKAASADHVPATELTASAAPLGCAAICEPQWEQFACEPEGLAG